MTAHPLRVIPLGGLGKIGRNMMVVEYANDILLIDAGILFPGPTSPGVDFAIPDITYLLENRDRVRALLITHGHEDHIGAIPYVLSDLDIPVFSSKLTHGLMSVKLRDAGILKQDRLNIVKAHAPFNIGVFQIEFFHVCHSIPDAMGIAITTPLGVVIHTGDFKIDHTPVDGKKIDFLRLAKIASKGVLLLMSDSTYSEIPGYTQSEELVGRALDRAIGEAEGRIIIATFASLISRIQQIVNAACKYDRKVVILGRSMANNVKIATKLGYLDIPDRLLITVGEARQLSPSKVLIIATGSQGEPTSALVRIANRKHRDIEVTDTDTVILSASPIPGNETVVAETIDDLFRQGANVLYSLISPVHVHGHASQEELKMMLGVIQPKFFVPVHGEYRHLKTHAALAVSMGLPESNTFVLEDGDVLELTQQAGNIVGTVPSGQIFISK